MTRARVEGHGLPSRRTLVLVVRAWPLPTALILGVVVAAATLIALGLHGLADVAATISVVVAVAVGLVLLGIAALVGTLTFRALVFLAEADKFGPEPAAGAGVHVPGNLVAGEPDPAVWNSVATEGSEEPEVWT